MKVNRPVAIWIIGSMGSGKTTLCRSLIKKLDGFTHFNIDDYRFKYNPSQLYENEFRVRSKFCKHLERSVNKDILVETVGTYKNNILHENKIIILLESSLKISEQRVLKRFNEKAQHIYYPLMDENETHEENLKRSIRQLSYYKNIKPDFKINTDSLSPEEILDIVWNYLKEKI